MSSTNFVFNIFESMPEKLLSRFTRKVEGEQPHYFLVKEDISEGREKLYAYAHSKGYKDFTGLNWIMVIEHDKEEIFAPVFKLRSNFSYS